MRTTRLVRPLGQLLFLLLFLTACSSSSPYDPCANPEVGTVSLEEAPLGLAIDGEHVYWSSAIPLDESTYRYEIRRGRRDGNGSAETIASSTAPIGAIAMSHDDVVWVEESTVYAANKASSAVRTIGTLPGSAGAPDLFALAADDNAVYVLTHDFADGFRYTVWRVGFDGASVGVASHELPVGIDVRSMQLREGILVWAFQSGWLFRTTVDARDAIADEVLDDPLGIDGFHLDEGAATFITEGSLRTVPLVGGNAVTLDAKVDAYRAITSRAGHIVWGARDHHTSAESIHWRDADGRSCSLVSEGVMSAYSMLESDGIVYWTNTASAAFGGAVRWVRVGDGALRK